MYVYYIDKSQSSGYEYYKGSHGNKVNASQMSRSISTQTCLLNIWNCPPSALQ